MKSKVILITGSARGIGKLSALELAKRGHIVYGTMRTPISFEVYPENLFVKTLDVTKQETIDLAVQEILKEQGRLDVVINNAGYGLLAPVEMAAEQEIKDLFDVNVYGVWRVSCAVLPLMRAQKSGHIINISSIAGIASNPGLGWYCATKHALEAFSASLAATVFPWDIKVTVIQPAGVATQFADSLRTGSRLVEENPYMGFCSRYAERMAQIVAEGQSPYEVACVIADVVATSNPDFRIQTNDRVREIAGKFLADPAGNRWLNEQKEKFSSWFL